MKAGETTVLRLLQGSKVFLIPNFQRRYAWRQNQWEALWDDVEREFENQKDSYGQEFDGHFLGSVVLHPAPGPASTLMRHLVIDGQQRLTTILVLLAAIRDVRAAVNPSWDPNAYTTKYLSNPFEDRYPDRLVPTEFDREPYRRTVREGVPTGGIGQAYTYFRTRIEDFSTSESDLDRLGEVVLIHMILVEITTSTGDSVNNIFNTLNSKGLPLGATDLIRNELLLNLDEDEASRVYSTLWLPMERSLTRPATRSSSGDALFVTFFWAREVALNHTVTRKNLFQAFERRLRKKLDTVKLQDRQAAVIGEFVEIEKDHRTFHAVLNPASAHEHGITLSDGLIEDLDRLRRWGSDPYLPLALWIVRNHLGGHIEDSEARSSLQVLLGYLVRRALAGVASNNLNRLLSPLPTMYASATPDRDSFSSFLTSTLSRPAYRWPTDGEIRTQLPAQPVYMSVKRGQTKFLLEAVEEGMSGKERVNLTGLRIEHVWPQSMPTHWDPGQGVDADLAEDVESVINTLGNLTLTAYNSELSNRAFSEKRLLLAESPLRMNRAIAAESTWTPRAIHERSSQLLEIFVRDFRGPVGGRTRPEPAARHTALERDLVAALQTIPEGGWTTETELMQLLGADLESVQTVVLSLGAELARLVKNEAGLVPDWFSPTLHSAVSAEGQETDEFGKLYTADEIAGLRLASDQYGDILDTAGQTEA